MNPYPHEGGCECCRAAKRCSVCGRDINVSSHCTNGRCIDCHLAVCAPVGAAPLERHGYGSRCDAIAQEHMANSRIVRFIRNEIENGAAPSIATNQTIRELMQRGDDDD